ncbi:hypothetical protein NDU88_002355 [Pleurodeles waltl]|uniref:Uncharacterized protein n=1 Tax=Pleurodeles waltl TaxID=8319 RepID=A0AAV7UXE6_PLEWA|nr:hypothetical protein NDU88_002355 [Pleurodeles waltl]
MHQHLESLLLLQRPSGKMPPARAPLLMAGLLLLLLWAGPGRALVCLPCDESKCEEEPRSVLLGVCGCCLPALRPAEERELRRGLRAARHLRPRAVLRAAAAAARSLCHRRSGRMRKSQITERKLFILYNRCYGYHMCTV